MLSCDPPTTTSIPHASVSSGTAPSRRNRIDHEHRVADRCLETLHISNDTVSTPPDRVEKTMRAPLSATAAPTSSGTGVSPHS
jgi:hypothetical protein